MAINGLGFADDPAELNETIFPSAPTLEPLGVAQQGAGAQPVGRAEPGGGMEPIGLAMRDGTQAQGGREEPLIDPSKNPLGAIGAVLQNVSRGARGQRLYTDELRDQRMLREQRELQRLTVGVDAMTKGIELMNNTPAAQRAEVAQQYGQLFEQVLPGFTETLLSGARKPRDLMTTMEVLGEHGDTLVRLGGDLDTALELSQDTALIKRLDLQADRRNAPEITMAFKRAQEVLQSSPQGNEILTKAAADGWTLSDLQDPAIQKALGLTPSHVNTIMRSPDVQSNLRPFGFIPTSDLDEQAKQRAGQKSLDRIAAEERAKTTAREGAETIAFQNIQTGAVEYAAKAQQEAMRARGFEPVITGRTEQDLASREERRREGKETAPVNPYITSVLGKDPETSIADFRAEGGNPNVPDADIRSLQTLETGLKNTDQTIERIKSIVTESDGDANTWGAQVAGILANLRTNVGSIARAFGSDFNFDIDKELAKYDGTMRELGVQGAELQSLVMDLSYMAAVSRGQEGRGLSDNDVKRFSKIVGTSTADPVAFTRVLDSVVTRFDQSFRNQFESVVRKRPESMLPDIAAAESLAERFEGMTNDQAAREIAKLSPRARRELKLMLEAK